MRLCNLLEPLWRHRKLLARSTLIQLRTQYAGTVLGLLWILLGPLLLLSLYTVIYSVIFGIRVPNFTQAEYVLNVFSGLVPFLAFSQALSTATSSISKDKKLIFSTYPSEFVPTRAVIVAYVIVVPATLVVFIGDAIFSKLSWTSLLVLPVLFLQLMFSIGIGFMLALVGLVARDIQFLIQYIVIALLIATPIAYTPDMIPSGMKSLLYANPLFYFTSANQHLILLNKVPPTEIIIPMLALSTVAFIGGLWIFRRARFAILDLV